MCFLQGAFGQLVPSQVGKPEGSTTPSSSPALSASAVGGIKDVDDLCKI